MCHIESYLVYTRLAPHHTSWEPNISPASHHGIITTLYLYLDPELGGGAELCYARHTRRLIQIQIVNCHYADEINCTRSVVNLAAIRRKFW